MDKTKNTIRIFDAFAEGYSDKFMDLDLYHHSFDRLCTAITRQGAKVLELGCGPGNITRYLLQKRPDLQILGVDIAPNMLVLAQEHNPTARFQEMDCRNILELERNVRCYCLWILLSLSDQRGGNATHFRFGGAFEPRWALVHQYHGR